MQLLGPKRGFKKQTRISKRFSFQLRGSVHCSGVPSPAVSYPRGLLPPSPTLSCLLILRSQQKKKQPKTKQLNTSGGLHSRGKANVLRIMSWWKWLKFPQQLNRHWSCELLWLEREKKKKSGIMGLIHCEKLNHYAHHCVCSSGILLHMTLYNILQNLESFTSWRIRHLLLQGWLHQSKCWSL